MHRNCLNLIICILLLSLFAACSKQEQQKEKEMAFPVSAQKEAIPAKTAIKKYVTWAMWETDRAASIWLIKRYIDPNAEFIFIKKGDPIGDAIPFDIPQAELQRKHNTACFQVIMRKYKFNQPELKELSKLVWDIEINFWGSKKYPESIPFKEKFDAIFNQKLPPAETMKKCFVLFDEFIQNYNQKGKTASKTKVINTTQKEINIGTFYRGETRIVKFKLKNTSDKILEIKKVRKTCGCVNVSAEPLSIPANGDYTVTVKLVANKELYGAFIKSIYVTMKNAKPVKLSVIGNALTSKK